MDSPQNDSRPRNDSTDAEATLSASLSASSPSPPSPSSPPPASSDRYILTHIGTHQLVFPAHWVAEILLVDRSQILVLPFYDPMLLGMVHHQGRMIPLVAIGQILGEAPALPRETLSVVQLNDAADRLAGVGVVVDRASDNRLREHFPPALFQPSSTDDAPEHLSLQPESIQLFHPGLLNDRLWQPQRWQPTSFD